MIIRKTIAVLFALCVPWAAARPADAATCQWETARGAVLEAEPAGEPATLLSGDPGAPRPAKGRQGEDGDKAPGPIQAAFGERLVNAEGREVPAGDLEGKKVGLYFSAQWCPPCRAFTPQLIRAYEELKAAGKPFEIVLVSHDRDEAAMFRYMKEYRMPWLALPFPSPRRGELPGIHGVRGIPALVIVDSSGRVLSRDARGEILSGAVEAFDRW